MKVSLATPTPATTDQRGGRFFVVSLSELRRRPRDNELKPARGGRAGGAVREPNRTRPAAHPDRSDHAVPRGCIFRLHARSQTNIQTTPQTTIKEIGNITTVPFYETRTCIEDARASADYAEKMISLGDQYRREGNHAAANASLMLTWNIRANIVKITEVLPMLTPEHTQLLDPSVPRQLFLPKKRPLFLPVHPLGLAPLLGGISPVAGDVKLQDHGVVHDPVNRRGGGHGVGEDALPL